MKRFKNNSWLISINGTIFYIIRDRTNYRNVADYNESHKVEAVSIVDRSVTFQSEGIISAPEFWYKYKPTEKDFRRVMKAVFRK